MRSIQINLLQKYNAMVSGNEIARLNATARLLPPVYVVRGKVLFSQVSVC